MALTDAIRKAFENQHGISLDELSKNHGIGTTYFTGQENYVGIDPQQADADNQKILKI